MTKNKILFLHKCFIKGGGVERVHQNLSEALKEQSVDSCFYVIDGYGESDEGYSILSKNKKAFRSDEGASFFQKLRSLFDLIRNENITAIISATEVANCIALIAKARFPSLKVVYTRHCAFEVSDQSLPPWAIKVLYNFFALSGEVVGVSEALVRSLKQAVIFNKKNIHFVPNAVISEVSKQKSVINSDNAEYGEYFVAIGRLVEQKGFDLLIPAYAQAKQQAPELPKLVIYGEGQDELALKALSKNFGIEDSVIFAGYTENPYYAIKQAIAFILSSRHEGMPTVVVESMSLDTPVIAFNCPTGPSELIVAGVNGVLIEHLSIEQLASAIVSYKNLPFGTISDSVEHFKYENVSTKYLALCSS